MKANLERRRTSEESKASIATPERESDFHFYVAKTERGKVR
jgi:hypothetical protein